MIEFCKMCGRSECRCGKDSNGGLYRNRITPEMKREKSPPTMVGRSARMPKEWRDENGNSKK